MNGHCGRLASLLVALALCALSASIFRPFGPTAGKNVPSTSDNLSEGVFNTETRSCPISGTNLRLPFLIIDAKRRLLGTYGWHGIAPSRLKVRGWGWKPKGRLFQFPLRSHFLRHALRGSRSVVTPRPPCWLARSQRMFTSRIVGPPGWRGSPVTLDVGALLEPSRVQEFEFLAGLAGRSLETVQSFTK